MKRERFSFRGLLSSHTLYVTITLVLFSLIAINKVKVTDNNVDDPKYKHIKIFLPVYTIGKDSKIEILPIGKIRTDYNFTK